MQSIRCARKRGAIKALVTGASGHLGYHLCKLLGSEGWDVRALVRPSSFADHLKKLPVEICFGDVLDRDSISVALKDTEAVFHAAAVYKLIETGESGVPAENDETVTAAVDGTRNLLEAAARSGVRRIVYTSSVETIGLTYDRTRLLDETCDTALTFYGYSVAKVEAERLALALSEKMDIDIVICNPSTIIGCDDYKPTPSNAMLINFMKHSSFYVEGGQSLVDVEDVAKGHVQAFSKGRSRQRYVLSGENVEIGKLIGMIRDVLGKRGPLVRLNRTMLYPAALVFEALSLFTGQPPFFTRRKVMRSVGSYSFYDNSKAVKELGYSPRPLREVLPPALRWLRKQYL